MTDLSESNAYLKGSINCEQALAAKDAEIAQLRETNINNVACYQEQIEQLRAENARLEALADSKIDAVAARVQSENDAAVLRGQLAAANQQIERLESEVLLRTMFGPPKPGDQPAARAGADILREISQSSSDLTDKERADLAKTAEEFDRLVHEMLYWNAWELQKEKEIAAMKARVETLEGTLSQVGVVLTLHGITDTAAEVAKILNPQQEDTQ